MNKYRIKQIVRRNLRRRTKDYVEFSDRFLYDKIQVLDTLQKELSVISKTLRSLGLFDIKRALSDQGVSDMANLDSEIRFAYEGVSDAITSIENIIDIFRSVGKVS